GGLAVRNQTFAALGPGGALEVVPVATRYRSGDGRYALREALWAGVLEWSDATTGAIRDVRSKDPAWLRFALGFAGATLVIHERENRGFGGKGLLRSRIVFH